MKRITKILIASVAAVLAAACTKEIEQVFPVESKETVKVSFEGIISGYEPQGETKASAQNVVRIMWEGGENVYAYEGQNYIGTLTASVDGTDGTYAFLSGQITAPSGEKPVTLVYSPLFDGRPTVKNGAISLDLSTQNTKEVPFLIYGEMPASAISEVNDAVVKFALATSVYKCNCGDLPPGDISRAEIGQVNTVCELKLSNDASAVVSGSKPGSIIRTAGFTAADRRAIFSVALPETGAATIARTIRVTKGNKTFAAAFSNSSFMPAMAINALFMFKTSSPTYPDGALLHKFTVDENGTQVWFSRGNLYWNGTSFNFEADQLGYAAQWNPSHVSHFFWRENEEESYTLLADENSELSFDDVLFTNVPGFTVNGQTDVWRNLSSEEWGYLMSHHKTKLTYVEHILGFAIAPDGFEGTLASKYDSVTWADAEENGVVFLSACGERTDRIIRRQNEAGAYWTSSASENNVTYAKGLFFADRLTRWDYEDWRNFGNCIRLVSDCGSIDGVCINATDKESTFMANRNIGAEETTDLGSVFSSGDLVKLRNTEEWTDGWRLPEYEDVKSLANAQRFQTDTGTVFLIDGKLLTIPYSKEFELADGTPVWESRLWLADGESFFWFRSDGKYGRTMASDTRIQEYNVRLVKKI